MALAMYGITKKTTHRRSTYVNIAINAEVKEIAASAYIVSEKYLKIL